MPENTEGWLEHARAHWEIEQMWVRYFDRIDAQDPSAAVECFSEDAQVDIMTGRRFTSRDDYLAVLERVLAQYASTSHHLSNVRVELDGPQSARMVAYVYAFHRLKETGEPWHLWVRIVDRIERRGGAWRVKEHVLHAVDSHPRWEKIADDWYKGHPDMPAVLKG